MWYVRRQEDSKLRDRSLILSGTTFFGKTKNAVAASREPLGAFRRKTHLQFPSETMAPRITGATAAVPNAMGTRTEVMFFAFPEISVAMLRVSVHSPPEHYRLIHSLRDTAAERRNREYDQSKHENSTAAEDVARASKDNQEAVVRHEV